MLLTLLALLPALAVAAPAKRSTYSGAYIQAGRDNLCLSVKGGPGASLSNGVPVVSVPCQQATTWDINLGSGSVLVHGSNSGFALDAGSNPGNNGALKIWQSYPGLYQQTWYLTNDNRIAITGGNQCLDEGTNGIQTYQCTTGNTNQIFYVSYIAGGNPGPSTTPPITTTTTTTQPPAGTGSPITTQTQGACTPTATYGTTGCVPTGPVYQDPSTGGKRIHPNGRPDLCVTVQNGFPGIGTNVEITGCFANEDNFIGEQLWDLPSGTGAVRLHGSNNLCLDAGDSPANGSGLKIWTCYDGLLQQTWTWNANGSGNLALGNGQCLDVQAGSAGNYPQKPYGSVEVLQTWQCSTNGDPQQAFFTLS